jgi:hypothetical protein
VVLLLIRKSRHTAQLHQAAEAAPEVYQVTQLLLSLQLLRCLLVAPLVVEGNHRFLPSPFLHHPHRDLLVQAFLRVADLVPGLHQAWSSLTPSQALARPLLSLVQQHTHHHRHHKTCPREIPRLGLLQFPL